MSGGNVRTAKLSENYVAQAILLILASTLPFLNGVSEEFVFDDIPGVLHNQDVTNPDPSNIFLHDFWGENITRKNSHKSYRPLTTLTFWIQNQVTPISQGASPMKHVNIALHSLNTILLHIFLNQALTQYYRSSSCWKLSFLVSFIFGCHPVHVEPILSVVGRSDLLFSMIFLISAIVNAVWQPESQLQISTKCLLLALLTSISMFCKESGIVFLVFWYLTQLAQTRFVRKKVFTLSFFLFSLFIVVTLAFLAYLRMSVMNFQKPTFQKHDNPAAFANNFIERLLNFNYIYLVNFTVLLYPNWLCFDWAMRCLTPLDHSDSRIFLVIAFWIILIGLVAKIVKYQKSELLAFSLLIVPFILSLNIFVYVGFVIAERQLYLSLAGISLFICKGFLLLRAKCAKFKSALSLLMFLTVFSFLAKSYFRSLDWRNEMNLFQSGLKVCYNNAKVHYNIAKKLADNNQINEAVTFYVESIRLQPDYEHAFNNLANLMKSKKRFSEAETLLLKATEINPKFAAAFMNLGIVQQAQGKFESAEASYNTALHLRPVYSDCEYNLGNLYLKTRKLHLAEERFRVAANLNHERAFLNLIILLDEQSQLVKAKDVTKEALQKFPTNPEFVFQMANILGQQKHFEESEEMYLRAIAMKNSGLYWSNLGVLYHLWNKTSKAIECYERALMIDSSLASAKVNLDKLLKRK